MQVVKRERRSTTDYCSYVWGNLVTWKSKKQPMVSRSSAESRYPAVALGTYKGIWIRRLLNELKCVTNGAIRIYSDSRFPLAFLSSKYPVHHVIVKRMKIDRRFISEKVKNRTDAIELYSYNSRIADILNKAAPLPSFEVIVSKLGLSNIYNQA